MTNVSTFRNGGREPVIIKVVTGISQGYICSLRGKCLLFFFSALDPCLLFFYLQGENWKQFLCFILYYPRALLLDLLPAAMQLLVKLVCKDKHLLQKTQTKHEWGFPPLLCFLPHPGSECNWQQILQNSDLAKFQQLCVHTYKALSPYPPCKIMWDRV